ncbi:hypothetical protein WDU94_005836 [Cyamophila willieti]
MAFSFLTVFLVGSICATKLKEKDENSTINSWQGTIHGDLKTAHGKNSDESQGAKRTFNTWENTKHNDSKTWQDTKNDDLKTAHGKNSNPFQGANSTFNTWDESEENSTESDSDEMIELSSAELKEIDNDIDITYENSTTLHNGTTRNRGTLGDDNTEDVVVVFGVPQKKNEDLMKTVKEIGHKVGIHSPLKDVLKVERSPVPELEPDPVVIHLHNATIKDNWTDAYAGKQFQQNNEWYYHLPKHIWVLNNETKPLSEVEKLNATLKEGLNQTGKEKEFKQMGKEKQLNSKAKKDKLKPTFQGLNQTYKEKELNQTGKEKEFKQMGKEKQLNSKAKKDKLKPTFQGLNQTYKEKELKQTGKEKHLKSKAKKDKHKLTGQGLKQTDKEKEQKSEVKKEKLKPTGQGLKQTDKEKEIKPKAKKKS